MSAVPESPCCSAGSKHCVTINFLHKVCHLTVLFPKGAGYACCATLPHAYLFLCVFFAAMSLRALAICLYGNLPAALASKCRAYRIAPPCPDEPSLLLSLPCFPSSLSLFFICPSSLQSVSFNTVSGLELHSPGHTCLLLTLSQTFFPC